MRRVRSSGRKTRQSSAASSSASLIICLLAVFNCQLIFVYLFLLLDFAFCLVSSFILVKPKYSSSLRRSYWINISFAILNNSDSDSNTLKFPHFTFINLFIHHWSEDKSFDVSIELLITLPFVVPTFEWCCKCLDRSLGIVIAFFCWQLNNSTMP